MTNFIENIQINLNASKMHIKELLKIFIFQFLILETNLNYNSKKKYAIETREYIKRNMQHIRPLKSKFAVHEIALNEVSLIDGKACEFGVYLGGTINFLAKKNFLIYGFDSFEGLPEDWREGFKKGKFNLFKKLPKVRNNVILYPGKFDQSIPRFIQNQIDDDFTISYLHIDCDLYSSTKEIFSLLEKNIVSGTIVVFDEYFNFPGWKEGEFLAFQEFIKFKNLNYEYITYNYLHQQVAIKIL